jgi:hypothetical protein
MIRLYLFDGNGCTVAVDQWFDGTFHVTCDDPDNCMSVTIRELTLDDLKSAADELNNFIREVEGANS